MQKNLQKFKLYFNFVIEMHNFSSYTHLKYDGCRIFAKQCFLSSENPRTIIAERFSYNVF